MKPKDPWLLLRIYLSALLFMMLRKFVGIHHIIKVLSESALQSFFRLKKEDFLRLQAYTRFVLSHWPFNLKDRDCLIRSLVLYSFLKPIYKDLRFVLGVNKKKEPHLKGHAWLELKGLPILDPPDRLKQYERLIVV